jgi:hypothetical protein
MIFRAAPATLIPGKHNWKISVLGTCNCFFREVCHLTEVKFTQIAFTSCCWILQIAFKSNNLATMNYSLSWLVLTLSKITISLSFPSAPFHTFVGIGPESQLVLYLTFNAVFNWFSDSLETGKSKFCSLLGNMSLFGIKSIPPLRPACNSTVPAAWRL